MRPGLVWGAFAACLAVLVAAMAWTTAIGLRLEQADVAARAAAALEENTRLALWRLDSAVTPLLAQESARPYFHYGAYYDAGAAYARMHNASASTLLAPSPLVKQTPAAVLLHFQVAPGGRVSSPEVPTGRLRTRALGEGLTTAARLAQGDERLAALGPLVAHAPVWREVAAQRLPPPTLPPTPLPASPGPLQALMPQKMKSVREYEQRQQNVASNQMALRDTANAFSLPLAPPRVEAARPAPGLVEEAAVAPLWVGDQLLLARQVRIDGVTYAQACWLDWPVLRRDLLVAIADLLPGAQLQPVSNAPAADDERRLAALPLRLVPGALPVAPSDERSVVQLSLAGAWVGLLVAAAAVALLLRAVMALSERRRVFVSAVTHELRTPLTTFRLYTDMMAEGMVPSEEKRAEYVQRLRVEAHRLGHLVENVLAYARLENRRPGSVREPADLRALVRSVAERMGDRVGETGLSLVPPDDAEPLTLRVDASVVEQIVVNLIDNACKYARPSQPATIELSVERAGREARVRVRDHGPGLSDTARRRLFQPFSKSDQEAASSAPGLGLGLALCRNLARAQGGDLVLDESIAPGASFVLSLPADP